MKKIVKHNGKDRLVYREGSGGTVEIFDIVVNSRRGVGRGRELIEELITLVDTHLIFAITRSSNGVAQVFYRKVDFELLAQLKGFYEDEDALIYAYRIPSKTHPPRE